MLLHTTRDLTVLCQGSIAVHTTPNGVRRLNGVACSYKSEPRMWRMRGVSTWLGTNSDVQTPLWARLITAVGPDQSRRR